MHAEAKKRVTPQHTPFLHFSSPPPIPLHQLLHDTCHASLPKLHVGVLQAAGVHAQYPLASSHAAGESLIPSLVLCMAQSHIYCFSPVFRDRDMIDVKPFDYE
jgi:hypothetical protein